MLRPYYTCVRRELVRWGGTVEKFIGDAVMAAFGAPVSHEDDAERAVRAALRVVRAVQELNAAEPDLDLALRAAVTTGEAVVTRGPGTADPGSIATGDVVTAAARAQAIAPVGAVVVDEATHRATRHVIEYAALDPASVPMAAGPIRMWRATSVRSAYGSDVTQAAPAPFIGRKDELALLKATYARATRQASVQLVTVAGEPGVGKSRLVREFRTFVDWQPEHARWRQGRCLPYGDGITFWALGEIVKNQAEILESDSPTEAADKLSRAIAAIVEDRAELDWLRTRLSPSGRRERARRRRAGGAVRVVRRLAALPRGRRRQPAPGPGLRGRALGRHGAARVPGVPRGLGGRPAVPHDLHDQTRSLRAPPGMGRRSAGLRNAVTLAALARGDEPADHRPSLRGGAAQGDQDRTSRPRRRQPAVCGRVRPHARRPRHRRAPGRDRATRRRPPTSPSPRRSRR